MSILFIDKTNTSIEEIDNIEIPEPTFKDELIEWTEDNSCGIKYSLAGLYFDTETFVSEEDAYIEDTCKVDSHFKSEISPRIRAYLKSLVRDIEKQALKSSVSLAYTHWERDEEKEEIIRCSELPQSVVDFWKVTDVDFEFIKDLIALVRNPDIAKFVYVNDSSYDEIAYGNLEITSDYEVAKRYFESVQSDIEYELNDVDDLPEDYRWYKWGGLIANDLGYKFYMRYIIEKSGHDLDYYKYELVDYLADKVIEYSDYTEADIKQVMRKECSKDNIILNGYVYLKHNKLVCIDEELNAFKEQLVEALYTDVLLEIIQRD